MRAEGVSFGYGGRPVVRDFSTTIMRGDKVGIIGPNGSGKTTLLRLLLGELPPQAGTLRHGTNLEIAYFDQLHAQLDEDRTVMDNVADGRDFVTVNGRRRHMIGYLQDFLFTPERARVTPARSPAASATGCCWPGCSRDPPTCWCWTSRPTTWTWRRWSCWKSCSLDYAGTLLLVSHDREFLNNVVTSTLVLEGDGRVGEYAGGYDDWLRQRPAAADGEAPTPVEKAGARSGAQRVGAADRPRRLTFKERLGDQLAAPADRGPGNRTAPPVSGYGRHRHLPAGRRRSGAG